MIPPVTTDLTLEQHFLYVQIKAELPTKSKEDLIEAVASLVKENMILKANVAQLVKYTITQDFKVK
jgi:hypothetical protein